MTSKAGVRNPALDGLRGLAALSVALGHCLVWVSGLALWNASLRDFASLGGTDIALRLASVVMPSDAAVMVFFVLSGHVLFGSFRRRNSGFFAGLPDYAAARAYRLLPVAIVSALPLGWIAAAPAHELVMNMLLLSDSLNGVLWSLQTEVVASLALFAVWGLTRGRGWKLCVALAVAFAATPFCRGNPYVVFLPAFILGAVIDGIPVSVRRNVWVIGAGVGALLLTNLVLGHGGMTRVFEILGATVVVGAVAAGRFGFLGRGVPLWLGTISYPFYLTHPFGLDVAAPRIAGLFPLSAATSDKFVRTALLAVASIAITVPIAWLLHVAVEAPALRVRPHLQWPGSAAYRAVGDQASLRKRATRARSS